MTIQYDAKILSVTPETENIYTFIVERHKDFKFNPGQYVWMSLDGHLRSPMAIASGQNDDHLMFTVRKWGELTTALFNLSETDKIHIDGPYGTHFPVEVLNNGNDLYLIAGGTGITPIRSLMRSLTNGTMTHLFYGAQESEQLLYLEEFKETKSKLSYTIDNAEEAWNENVGYVTDLLLQVTFTPNAKFFVCGPPPMLKATTQFLKDRQFDTSNVYVSIERFDKNGNVVGPVLQLSDPKLVL